jgi:hypothetical protein
VNSNRIVSQAQKESKPHIKLLKELIGLVPLPVPMAKKKG